MGAKVVAEFEEWLIQRAGLTKALARFDDIDRGVLIERLARPERHVFLATAGRLGSSALVVDQLGPLTTTLLALRLLETADGTVGSTQAADPRRFETFVEESGGWQATPNDTLRWDGEPPIPYVLHAARSSTSVLRGMPPHRAQAELMEIFEVLDLASRRWAALALVVSVALEEAKPTLSDRRCWPDWGPFEFLK